MFSVIKWKPTLVFALFVLSSPFALLVTRSFLSIMLGFNVFLAFIPLYLIWLLKSLLEKAQWVLKLHHVILFLVFVFAKHFLCSDRLNSFEPS